MKSRGLNIDQSMVLGILILGIACASGSALPTASNNENSQNNLGKLVFISDERLMPSENMEALLQDSLRSGKSVRIGEIVKEFDCSGLQSLLSASGTSVLFMQGNLNDGSFRAFVCKKPTNVVVVFEINSQDALEIQQLWGNGFRALGKLQLDIDFNDATFKTVKLCVDGYFDIRKAVCVVEDNENGTGDQENFNNPRKLQSCGANCADCTSVTKCDICYENASPSSSSQTDCTCPDYSYSDTSTLSCIYCGTNCQTCDETGCTQCMDVTNMMNNLDGSCSCQQTTCSCPSGYGWSTLLNACAPLYGISDFQVVIGIQNGDVAQAIMTIQGYPLKDSSVFQFLVTSLKNFTNNTYASVCDFNIVGQAASSLFYYTQFLTDSLVEDLFALLKFTANDYTISSQNDECSYVVSTYLALSTFVLNYYETSLGGYGSQFYKQVNTTDEVLNEFIANVFQNQDAFRNGEFSFSSQNAGIAPTSNAEIFFNISINIGDTFGCSSNLVVYKLLITYQHLSNFGEIVSLQFYEGGSIVNFDWSYTTLSPIPVCDSVDISIETYKSAPYGENCISTHDSCDILHIEASSTLIQANSSGIYYLEAICEDKNCLACNIDPDVCIQCNEDTKNENGICVCLNTTGKNEEGYCVPCHDKNCKTCANDYKVCETCIDSNASPHNSICECDDPRHGFDDSSICRPCIDVHCSNCSTNYEICEECLDDTFILQPNGTCVCTKGFGFNNDTCSPCDHLCGECYNDHKVCTKCIDHDHTNLENGVCQCKSGLGYDSEGFCQPCAPSHCLECSSYNNCTECVDSVHGGLVNNTCACFEGYGFDTDSFCKPCEDKHCDICNHNYTICETCIDDTIFPHNGVCLCENGKGFNDSSLCTPCSDKRCELCEKDFENCTLCIDKTAKVNENGMCECPVGFGFDNEGFCHPCSDHRCAHCHENYEICEECIDADHTTINNGKCECFEKFGFNDSSLCTPCSDINCVSCYEDFEICTECSGLNLVLSNEGTCVCAPHTGPYNSTACLPCQDTRCSNCTHTYDVCEICFDSEHAKPNENHVCTCSKEKGFNDENMCQECADVHCADCNENYEICSVCNDTSITPNNTGYCNCNPGSGFGENSICHACADVHCEECGLNFEICEVCKDHNIFPNQDGTCNCLGRTGFNNHSICVNCENPYCGVCAENFTICETCINHDLDPANCLCQPGFGYDDDFNCHPCRDENCLECFENYTICENCKDHLITPNETGICECPERQGFNDSSICTPCKDSHCTQCGTNYTICEVCDDPELYPIDGVCTCLSGTGFDENGICRNCSDPHCEDCHLDYKVCEVCKDHSINPNENYICECDPRHGFNKDSICNACIDVHCANCSQNYEECSQCIANNATLNETHHCQCPHNNGFNSDSECSPCADHACKECSQNYEICEVCDDESLTPNGNGKCVCRPGTGFDEEFICRPCSDKNCEECPSNYLECEVCKDKVNTFLNDSTCACNKNDIGFNDNGFCVPCEDINCLNCTHNYTQCIQCKDSSIQPNDNFVCECNPGKGFDSEGICHPCEDVHCKDCSINYQECEVCIDDTASLNQQNHCVCPQYEGFDKDSYCQPCSDHNCGNCSANYTVCISCKNPSVVLNSEGNCGCEQGFGFNSQEGCQECKDINCKSCFDNYTECTECIDPTITPNEYGNCSCGHNRGFDSNGYCHKCEDAHCSECPENYEICDECIDGEIQPTDGLCICPNYKGYNKDSICVNCNDTNCFNCSNSYTVCNECIDPNLNPDETNGVCECPVGFGFNDNHMCERCRDHNCRACGADYEICESCVSSTATIIDGNCTCPHSQGFNHLSECEPCEDPNCENCPINFAECQTCFDTDLAHVNATGYCNCLNKYGFNSTHKCEPCTDEKCLICSENHENCDECVDKTMIFQQGLCTCPLTTGYNSQTEKCVACADDHCDNCTENYQDCAHCVVPYFSENGDCILYYRFVDSSILVNGAVFDSGFSILTIALTSNLESSLLKACSDIFSNADILGTNSVCSFPNEKTIRIVVGSGWVITKTTTLRFKNTILSVSGSYYKSAPTVDIPIIFTVEPIAPTPVITGPSVFPISCEASTVIYSASLSSGPSAYSFTYEWKTSATTGTQSTLNYLLIDSSMVTNWGAITSFDVTLTVSNQFGSNSISLTVSIANTRYLTVALSSGNSITSKVGSAISIHSSVVDFCGQSGSTFAYSWTCTPAENSKLTTLGTTNQLKIPALTLTAGKTYTCTGTIKLTDSSGASLSGSQSVTIKAVHSDLIISIDRVSGDISRDIIYTTTGYVLDGSSSRDPDGAALTYKWTSTPDIFTASGIIVNNAKIIIKALNIDENMKVDITLEISTSDGRKTSVTNTFKVNNNVNADIKIVTPEKIRSSTALYLGTSITSEQGLEIQWTIRLGPSVTINPNYYSFLNIPANILTQGQIYTFQITATQSNGYIMVSYTAITVNSGVRCPSGPLVTPASGRALRQLFTAIISNCVDQDGEDYPLLVRWGYNNGKSNIQLVSQTKALSYASSYPALKVTIYATVVDSLQDGATYSSSAFTPSLALRSLLDDVSITNQYKEDIQKYEAIQVIVNYLNSYTISSSLLDIIWKDFTSYVAEEDMDTNLMYLILSTVNQFMNDLQQDSLDYARMSTYVTYIESKLLLISKMEDDLSDQILAIADRIVEVNSDDMCIQLSQTLVSQLTTYYNIIGATPFSQNTAHISVYKSENSIDLVSMSPIVLGDASIQMDTLGLPQKTIVSVKATNYEGFCSDIVSVSVIIDKKYENYEVLDLTPTFVDLTKGKLTITMPKSTCENPQCVVLTSNSWVAESCSIISSTDSTVTIQIQESGTYSFRTEVITTASNSQPLYTIICLSIAAIISFSLLFYVEAKNKTSRACPSYEMVSSATDRKNTMRYKSSTDIEETPMTLRKRQADDGHLVIGLIKGNRILNRSTIVLIVISAIVLEIFLVNLFGNYVAEKDLHPVIIGLIATALALPAEFVIMLMLSGTGMIKNILGYILVFAMYATSIVGVMFAAPYASWVVAFFTALGAELIVSQSLIMILSRSLGLYNA